MLWRVLGWGGLAALGLHLAHAASLLPAASLWWYGLLDLPYAAGHQLAPLVRWGLVAAGAASLAMGLGHGARRLARRVVIFRA